MKEIQDTVSALRKQLEDIDKKDKDEDKESANKKEEEEEEQEAGEQSHAILINEKHGEGIQIMDKKEANETSNVTSTKNTTANNNTSPSKTQSKFDRFVKQQKIKQQDTKNLADNSNNSTGPSTPAQIDTKANSTKHDAQTELTIVQDFH